VLWSLSAARVSLSGVAPRWRVRIYRRGGGCQAGPAVSGPGLSEREALVVWYGTNGFGALCLNLYGSEIGSLLGFYHYL
jgi:hypothetical protein